MKRDLTQHEHRIRIILLSKMTNISTINIYPSKKYLIQKRYDMTDEFISNLNVNLNLIEKI